MWVPKWYFEAQARRVNELEKRIERLELMLSEGMKKKNANLSISNKKASNQKN